MQGRVRFVLALALPLALQPIACAESGGAEPTIEATELVRRIEAGEAPVVLDVRTPEEFASGHVPGARNVPHDELAARLAELDLDPDAEIVVHCKSGRRAGMAEEVLRDAGFTRVRDLEGHMDAWREAGHPIEQ